MAFMSPQPRNGGNRQGAGPRDGGGGGGQGGLMARIEGMLGKKLRYNRFLAKLATPELLFKVPDDVGVDEENVSFGMGLTGAIAAGAAWTLTQQAPRECILRDLVVAAVSGNTEFSITSIAIEGKNVHIGGAGPGTVYGPLAIRRPEFSIPVAGGCTVQIQGNNLSVGAQTYSANWRID